MCTVGNVHVLMARTLARIARTCARTLLPTDIRPMPDSLTETESKDRRTCSHAVQARTGSADLPSLQVRVEQGDLRHRLLAAFLAEQIAAQFIIGGNDVRGGSEGAVLHVGWA